MFVTGKNVTTKRENTIEIDDEQLEEYVIDSVCLCTGPCECEIEPDGVCGEGWPSVLLALNMI